MDKHYENQVKLLLEVLPLIAKESSFALKGGTAINLFIRDMPRLSIDIDLTYLPIEPRSVTLENLKRNLNRFSETIPQVLKNATVLKHLARQDKQLNKLTVFTKTSQIKIECNEILRGSVYPTISSRLCTSAKKYFLCDVVDVPVLSLPDLYGG